MFEKEAEEYTKQRAKALGINDLNLAYHTMQRAYQYGAEFGYNKAKEEGKVVVEHFEAYGQCRDSRRIAGLEQENAELKAQIEKLKCCENCKHHCFWGNELNCRDLSYDEELECMETKSRWEEIKDENN